MAKKDDPKKTKTALMRLEGLFTANQSKIAAVLPSHMKVEKLVRSAMMTVSLNPDLQKCTSFSILRSVMVAASLGLEPGHGALGGAHLVPFRNKDTGNHEAILIPDYRGLVSLARRSGHVRDVEARGVYDSDEHFKYELGLNPVLEHKPSLRKKDSKPLAFYAIFTAPDGTKTFELMWEEEIQVIKKRARAQKGPWVSDYGEMAKKTVVKRGLKLKDMSPEFALALAIDDAPSGTEQFELLGGDSIIDVDAEEVEPPVQSSELAKKLAKQQAAKAAKKAEAKPAAAKPAAKPAEEPAEEPDKEPPKDETQEAEQQPAAEEQTCGGCGEPMTGDTCEACGRVVEEREPGEDDDA